MPYAPSTPDKSANFIFDGMQSAQDRELKQQQINLEAQQQMMDSAGSIMDLVNSQSERGTKNAEAADFQKATWEGYKRMLGESAITPDMNEKFYGGGIGAQRAMNEQLGMLAQQAAPQFQPSVTALGIPGFSFVHTSKGSGQLVDTNPPADSTTDRAANYKIITRADGTAVRINILTGQVEPIVDSSGNPVQPKSDPNMGFDPDAVNASRSRAKELEVARLRAETETRGEDAKDGPNWLPGKTLGEQLAIAEEELKVLKTSSVPARSGGYRIAPSPPTAAPNASGYQTAEDVHRAFRNGELSQTEAHAILVKDFRYKP